MIMMRQAKGFTVTELVIVLAIIAILAVMAYPQLRPNRLVGATRMIFADLQHARMEAITRKHPVRVLFDTDLGCHTYDGHTYTIHYDEIDENGDCDDGEDLMTKDIHRDYSGVTFSANENPTFNPVGTSNSGTVTITEGSDTKLVIFSWTGRIRIQ